MLKWLYNLFFKPIPYESHLKKSTYIERQRELQKYHVDDNKLNDLFNHSEESSCDCK
jgi:hypothetical protein